MITNYGSGTQYPTVNLAVNKSRFKLYDKRSSSPTYYLSKGQEFQIEIFNPTRDIILAKISLNGKLISDGGLVLRPGERVFLDRFLEENKKFLYDTYNVSNTEAVKKAIAENGDLRVDFYREQRIRTNPIITISGHNDTDWNYPFGGGNDRTIHYNDTSSGGDGGASFTTTGSLSSSNVTLDSNIASASLFASSRDGSPLKSRRRRVNKKRSKSIETGRVEKGSNSKQILDLVNKEFETYAFHSVSYKMLPLSQKNMSSIELVNKYCPKCGKKNKPTDKFCSNCGAQR